MFASLGRSADIGLEGNRPPQMLQMNKTAK
jgi:hypothetical protein